MLLHKKRAIPHEPGRKGDCLHGRSITPSRNIRHVHYLVVSNYFLQIAKTSTPRHMNMVALVAFRASEPVFVRPNLDVVLPLLMRYDPLISSLRLRDADYSNR